MKLVVITALAAILIPGPARAVMEPEEIMVRLATGLPLPPAYRGFRQAPKPNRWQVTPARHRNARGAR